MSSAERTASSKERASNTQKFPLPQAAALAVLSALCCQPALPQSYSLDMISGASLPSQTPANPATAYRLSDFEHYSPYNGSMSLLIPLAHVGGRGSVGYDVTAHIATHWSFSKTILVDIAANNYKSVSAVIPSVDTSPFWTQIPLTGSIINSFDPSSAVVCPQNSLFQGQWIPTSTLTRVRITRADGSQITLRDSALDGAPASPNFDYCSYDTFAYDAGRGSTALSRDGSHMVLNLSSPLLDSTQPGPQAGINGVLVEQRNQVSVTSRRWRL